MGSVVGRVVGLYCIVGVVLCTKCYVFDIDTWMGDSQGLIFFSIIQLVGHQAIGIKIRYTSYIIG